MVRTNIAALARRERNEQALRLRARGLHWADIASTCGFNSGHAAMMAVQRLMKRADRAAVQEARAIHRERIESLLRILWPAAVNPGAAHQAALAASQPPPLDQARAIDLMLRLLDQLARIEGLYASIAGPASSSAVRRHDVVAWRPDSHPSTTPYKPSAPCTDYPPIRYSPSA